MINRGVNPYVVDHSGTLALWYSGLSKFELWNLSNMSNLPTSKSIFFSIEPFECFCNEKCDSDLRNPWFYRNGIFDGQFDYVIGKGASGIVLYGYCHGVEAAFKFVDIGNQRFQVNTSDTLAELNRKLGEMRSIQATRGSKVLNFYGHYR